MDETAVCVVDEHGEVHLQTTALTDPIWSVRLRDWAISSCIAARPGRRMLPYRETEAAIAAAQDHGALAVEMEAAALYAFGAAAGRSVVCFAHVTNSMAQS